MLFFGHPSRLLFWGAWKSGVLGDRWLFLYVGTCCMWGIPAVGCCGKSRGVLRLFRVSWAHEVNERPERICGSVLIFIVLSPKLFHFYLGWFIFNSWAQGLCSYPLNSPWPLLLGRLWTMVSSSFRAVSLSTGLQFWLCFALSTHLPQGVSWRLRNQAQKRKQLPWASARLCSFILCSSFNIYLLNFNSVPGRLHACSDGTYSLKGRQTSYR